MEEKIIDNSCIEPKQIEIFDEMKRFNLNDFFHAKGASSGAIILITANQMIAVDAFASSPASKQNGTHYETVKKIYNAIYGDESHSLSENANSNLTWQELINYDDNILIQLCDPKSLNSTIWLPHGCSEKQIEFLEKIDEKIKIIKKEDIDYFKENPIIFDCMIDGEELCTLSDLSDFIEALKDNIRVDIYEKRRGGIK